MTGISGVPLAIWILLGVLGAGVIVLAVALYRTRTQFVELWKSVKGIDDDLALAEKTIANQVKSLALLMKNVSDLREQLANFLRTPVRPPVPPTDPLMKQTMDVGGKHSGLPPLPYQR